MTVTVPRVRFTPRYLLSTVDRTRTLGMFDEWAARADRVVEIRFPHGRLWVVVDPSLARAVLTTPVEQVGRSVMYKRMIAVLGHSLLTTDGAEHRRRRRLIQPAFAPQLVAGYAPAIVAAATETAERWRAGAEVVMEQEMAALTLAAIGRAVLGVDGRAEAARLGSALDRLQRAIALMLVPGSDRLLESRAPVLRRLRAAVAQMRAVASDATRSTAPLVESLRAVADGGEQLTATDLRDELLTMLLAGHETTAMTLTWAWWFLDNHPQVADRMRAEHAVVVGDRPPTYDDIEALPYTKAVVAETLRLRPPAWIIERQVTGEIDLDGLRPPRGTVLTVSPWLLHRDPQSWEEPTAYRPQRWLDATGGYDDTAPGQPRGAYLPFGAGSHVCVGAAFAWTEAILVLATLARQWQPARTFDELPMRATATLRPARKVVMRLELAPVNAAVPGR